MNRKNTVTKPLYHTNEFVEVDQKMRLPPADKWKQKRKRLVSNHHPKSLSQPFEATGNVESPTLVRYDVEMSL